MEKIKAESYNSPLIGDLLNEITEEELAKSSKMMKLAAKIDDARLRLRLSKSELAEKMSKKPSVISKWLSGTHNFTMDTLMDLEQQLGIQLIDVTTKEREDIVTVYRARVTEKSFRIFDYNQYSQSNDYKKESTFSSKRYIH